MKIKPTISKPCITQNREISSNGNFRGYNQTYSCGTLKSPTTNTSTNNYMNPGYFTLAAIDLKP